MGDSLSYLDNLLSSFIQLTKENSDSVHFSKSTVRWVYFACHHLCYTADCSAIRGPPTCFMKSSWFVDGLFRVSRSKEKVTLIANVTSCSLLFKPSQEQCIFMPKSASCTTAYQEPMTPELTYCPSDMFYIQLGRLKFVLTNQDVEGGKNCTVLTLMYLMYVNRKGIAVWQRFSLETALDINENELKI